MAYNRYRSTRSDETAPLLPIDETESQAETVTDATHEEEIPPFPYLQLFILGLVRLCEPIAFMSIFPYMYYMLKSFGIEDENQISSYAGIVTSAFTATECIFSMYWGKVSDRVGRKKVMMIGVAGTGLSMAFLGISTNFYMVLVARLIGGVLNGNIGVVQATAAEIAPHPNHKPRAIAVIHFVWSLGTIIGGFIGGTFSEPAKNWPGLVSPDGLFGKYPYLLPNLICVAFVFMSLIVSLLFLHEPHPRLRDQRDRGREWGDWLVSLFRSPQPDPPTASAHVLGDPESASVSDSSSLQPSLQESPADGSVEPANVKQISLRDSITPAIRAVFLANGLLAFHTFCLEQLLPIMFSSPLNNPAHNSLPFKFEGGLSLSTKTIGTIFAIQGVFQMAAQLVLFPFLSQRYGGEKTYRTTLFMYPFYYAFIPFVVLASLRTRYPVIVLIMAFKVCGQSLTFPSLGVIINNLSPSPDVTAQITSVYSAIASLARTIGPPLFGRIHSIASSHGYSGLSWWILSAVSVIGAIQGLTITPNPTE